MNHLADTLKKQFPNFLFHLDYPLAERTYFKVGGLAEVYLELSDRQQIIDFVSFCFAKQIKLTILGGASNVIVADEGVSGVVLHLSNDNFAVLDKPANPAKNLASTSQSADKIRVLAGAGHKMALLVQKTINEGLAGLEYFLGVPGTLGGAVINNAHYMQDLIGKYIDRVEVINKQGQVLWLNQEECDFAYDHSRFQTSGEIILQVEFLLIKGSESISRNLIQEATLYRAKTQPLGMPSSGCIFKNVANSQHLGQLFPQFASKQFVPAGFLIDQAGLKGTTVGKMQVSHKHASFIVNLGGGKASEIKQLIALIKQTVKEKFAIDLQEEVFYLS